MKQEVFCYASVDLDSFVESVRDGLKDKDKIDLILGIMDEFDHDESVMKLIHRIIGRKKYLHMDRNSDGAVYLYVDDRKMRTHEITLADMNDECLMGDSDMEVRVCIDLEKLINDLHKKK